MPAGAHPTATASTSACTGLTRSGRLQHAPWSVPAVLAASLHRQPRSTSACLRTMRGDQCSPSVVSLSVPTSMALNTAGRRMGGAGLPGAARAAGPRRAARSAFIASTSTCEMVSARSGERSASTGAVTGRKTIASDTAAGALPLRFAGGRSGGGARAERGCGCVSRIVANVLSTMFSHEAMPPVDGWRRYHSPEPRTRRLEGDEVAREMRSAVWVVLR